MQLCCAFLQCSYVVILYFLITNELYSFMSNEDPNVKAALAIATGMAVAAIPALGPVIVSAKIATKLAEKLVENMEED